MKVIIDLIEDIREEIANQESYTLHAMLLKEHPDDLDQLISVGEASIGSFVHNESDKKLSLIVDTTRESLTVGELIKHLLILPTPSMMHEILISINAEHPAVEVIGFGKDTQSRKYIFFIKL